VEAAVNQQISVEQTIAFMYLAMYSFFARDNVGECSTRVLTGDSQEMKK
jgi:hypothetical protein